MDLRAKIPLEVTRGGLEPSWGGVRRVREKRRVAGRDATGIQHTLLRLMQASINDHGKINIRCSVVPNQSLTCTLTRHKSVLWVDRGLVNNIHVMGEMPYSWGGWVGCMEIVGS